MNKIINISSNGIKQAIDDLVNENEILQVKVYKLEDTIKEALEYLEMVRTFALIDKINIFCVSDLEKILKKGE